MSLLVKCAFIVSEGFIQCFEFPGSLFVTPFPYVCTDLNIQIVCWLWNAPLLTRERCAMDIFSERPELYYLFLMLLRIKFRQLQAVTRGFSSKYWFRTLTYTFTKTIFIGRINLCTPFVCSYNQPEIAAMWKAQCKAILSWQQKKRRGEHPLLSFFV